MRLLAAVVIALLALLSVFALLNWGVISSPVSLSVGFTRVNAPLGLILLLALGLLTAVFLAFIIYQQGVSLVEARRFSRDLHASRELADKAEASRFTDLRGHLDAELKRMEQVLLARLAESENGLSASVAEVEDKIDRVLQSRSS